MKPLPHYYNARLTGGPFEYAELAAGGIPTLRTAPPPEFEGPGDAWSPEQLLLAAVESCFLFTFRAVARFSKVEFVTLTLDAEGTVDRHERVTRFTDIVLRASLTIPVGTDRVRALAALQKAKSACLVSASLSTPIRLGTEIREADAAALPVAS